MPGRYRDAVHAQVAVNAETAAGARERAAITVAISRDLIATAKATAEQSRLLVEESRRRQAA